MLAIATLPLFLVTAPQDVRPTGASSLQIEVATSRGRPAGELFLLVRAPGAMPRRIRTDKTGRASIELSGVDQAGEATTLLVTPYMIGQVEPTAVRIDRARPGPLQAKLTLPPAGTVRYVFYGKDERPGRLDAARLDSLIPIAEDESSATFYPVALNHPVSATADLPGVSGPMLTRGLGPKFDGGVTILEGRWNATTPILRFRVTHEGKALARQVVILALETSSLTGHHIAAVTDADGVIRWAVPPEASTQARAPILHVIHRPDAPPGNTIRTDLEDFGTGLPVGELDLGELALKPEQVVISGTVVDDTGRPIRGVRLSAASTRFESRRFGMYPGNGELSPLGHVAESAADGTFEFFGVDRPLREVTLLASAEGWLVNGRWPTIGTRDPNPKLTLERAYQVSGSVAPRLPAGIRAAVRYSHRGQGEASSSGANVQLDGSFVCRELRAGTYEVRFLDHHIRNVRVGPDTEPDPRLQNLDWREHRRLFRLEVKDAEGAPVSRARVWGRRAPDGQRQIVGSTNARGELVRLIPKARYPIEVKARGFLASRDPAEQEQIQITLQRGPEVSVNLPDREFLPRRCELIVTVIPGDELPTLTRGRWEVDRMDLRAQLSPHPVHTVKPQELVNFRPDQRGEHHIVLLPTPDTCARLPNHLRAPVVWQRFVVRPDGSAPRAIRLAIDEVVRRRITEIDDALK